MLKFADFIRNVTIGLIHWNAAARRLRAALFYDGLFSLYPGMPGLATWSSPLGWPSPSFILWLGHSGRFYFNKSMIFWEPLSPWLVASEDGSTISRPSIEVHISIIIVQLYFICLSKNKQITFKMLIENFSFVKICWFHQTMDFILRDVIFGLI